MKVLIVVSCALAVASAGILSPVVSSQFHAQDELGQYSYGYSGGPSAKQEARTADGVTRGGYSYVDGHGLVQSVSYVADPVHGFRVAATNLPQAPIDPANPVIAAAHPVAYAAAPVAYAAAPVAYAAAYPQHLPIIGHNGVPLDTPEVSHAKAAHFAAHAEAKARSGHGHWIAKRSLAYAYPQHLPVIGANGVPLDTPEVNAAKAHHFQAVAEAKARNGDNLIAAYAAPITTYAAPIAHSYAVSAPIAHSYAVAAPIYSGAHGYHIPVIGPNGVPLDTPEVNAAKANHYQAVVEAKARNGNLHEVPVVYAANYASPLAYAQHVPLIAHNGVPLDTPEVSHAKAVHFAAHASAHAGVHLGVADTPEVSHAKAAHFAAHAEAAARNQHY